MAEGRRAARRPAAWLAALAASSLLSGAPAFAETVTGPGYQLAIDETMWRPIEPVPPADLAFACTAPHPCAGGTLTLLRDARPLPSPGAGAFGPGAVAGATLTLRAQALTPGARLVQDGPAEPAMLGGRHW